jgi:two-component system sensor histidine kinase DesK
MTEDGNDCGSATGEAADRSRRPSGGWYSPLDSRTPNRVRMVAATVWLGFIVFPLANAIGNKSTAVDRGLVIAGAAVFVASYVMLVLRWRDHPRTPLPLLLFGVMVAVSAALTISHASSWGFLFTYCAACAALVTPGGFWAVALCTVLAGVCTAIGGGNGGTIIGFVASSAGIGLLMLVMRDLRVRNLELTEARAELARLAVAEERERFARDLHDLLGHSLSVIALKAELARRMLADGPDDAAKEVAELEQVARGALSEVREAVSGYRQPTLDGELAGARMALSAAGIEADIQQARVSLDPAVEAVLAWAVREGATNVIRHSGARHCTLKISATLTDASVEVIDDGRGAGDAADGHVPRGAGVTSRARAATGVDAPTPVGVASGAAVPNPADLSGRVAIRAGEASAADVPMPAVAANGVGDPGGPRTVGGVGGHGLAGLAERAALLNGTIDAGPLSGGGYRLVVTVPVSHA